MKLLFQNKAVFTSDVKGPMHSHSFWQLDFYESVQSCRVDIGDEKVLYADGRTLILIAPYTPHMISTSGRCTCYAIKFEAEENAFPGIGSGLIKYEDHAWLFNRLFSIVTPQNELDKSISEHLLAILMLELRKEKGFHSHDESRMDQRVRNAIAYMSQYMLSELTASSIASAMNVSVTHFTRLFRTETGMGPMHYLRKLKIDKAAKMLKFSDFNIGQIAEMLRYPDIHTFSRAFKVEKGISPRAYRETEAALPKLNEKKID